MPPLVVARSILFSRKLGAGGCEFDDFSATGDGDPDGVADGPERFVLAQDGVKLMRWKAFFPFPSEPGYPEGHEHSLQRRKLSFIF